MPDPVLPALPYMPISPHEWTVLALRTLINRQEETNTLMSALTDEVAALKTNVADLATRISSEISDLAAAVAALGSVSPEVTDAIAAIHATNAQLVALSGSLTADDQPAPPSV